MQRGYAKASTGMFLFRLHSAPISDPERDRGCALTSLLD